MMLLGGEVRIPTVDGRSLALTIPPTTQDGRVFRLRGQGMPHLGRPDQRGDLHAEVHARLPEQLNWRQWKDKVLSVYRAIDTQTELWHLPNGQTLRVFATARPQGGAPAIPNVRINRVGKELDMKVQPLADRILVKRLDAVEEKRGGIIIPDTAKEKPQQGEVIAVGPGKLADDGKRVPLEVAKGAKVLLGKYAGTEVKIDGQEYVILREDDILGIVG